MASADELNEDRQDPIGRVAVLSPADPVSLKEAFRVVIDTIITGVGDALIDWGTFTVVTTRMLNHDNGQELIRVDAAIALVEVGE